MLKNQKKLYVEELKLLEESARTLEYSYSVCTAIGLKDEYTLDELDRFEALTSRFARTSDLIVQKIFRLIDILELEQTGSIIDRINNAERRGIVSSAETFKEIRALRNQISHEYLPEQLMEIFAVVLEFTPVLLKTITKIKFYKVKGW